MIQRDGDSKKTGKDVRAEAIETDIKLVHNAAGDFMSEKVCSPGLINARLKNSQKKPRCVYCNKCLEELHGGISRAASFSARHD